MTSGGATDAVVLSIADLTCRYGKVSALRDVSLEVNDGQFVTLLGPSGCGKTTLLRAVAGFVRPSAGSIAVRGQDILMLPPEKRPVNMVFQRYALFPHLDVGSNVAFGLEVAGVAKQERDARVTEALHRVRLSGYQNRRVSELSGGQQQRVALARAVVNRPSILLLDEPLGALDLKLRKEMQVELRRLHAELGTTFIYVTHDQEEALVMSDRVVVMRDGGIEQDGAPQEVYLRPRTRFVAGFIGDANLLEATLEGDELLIAGSRIPARPAVGDPSRIPRRLIVLLRPEHLSLGSVGDAGLPGVIVDSMFLGPVLRHLIQLGDGRQIAVHNRSEQGGLRCAGDKVVVRWRTEDARVFEEEGGLACDLRHA